MKKGMVLLILCLCACSPKPHRYSSAVVLMGAVCRITLYTAQPAKKTAAILQECIAYLQMLDNVLDFHNPQSFLNTINKNAGIAPLAIPKPLQPLFERVVFFAKHTSGAFNPVLGAVIQLWNSGVEHDTVPAPDHIRQALSHTDYRIIQYENGHIFLPKAGMHYDLGAIVKGFAADEVATILKTHTIPSAVIDIGGTLRLIGNAPNSTHWTIGIRDPFPPLEAGEKMGQAGMAYHGETQAAIITTGVCSISTSGSYERFFEKDGRTYHHIIDPSTGYPVDNGLRSVTIITDSAADADALSTACFVLGYEASLPLLAAVPHTDAIFIFDDATVRITPGIAHTFQIRNPRYSLLSQGVP